MGMNKVFDRAYMIDNLAKSENIDYLESLIESFESDNQKRGQEGVLDYKLVKQKTVEIEQIISEFLEVKVKSPLLYMKEMPFKEKAKLNFSLNKWNVMGLLASMPIIFVSALGIVAYPIFLIKGAYNSIPLVKSTKDNGCYLINIKTVYAEAQGFTEVYSHEFAHHILHQNFDDSWLNEHQEFQEGFCRGIQRHVDSHFGLMQSKFMIEEVELMTKILTGNDPKYFMQHPRLILEHSYNKEIYNHSIGNCFFLLLENRHGQEVYKDILKGKVPKL